MSKKIPVCWDKFQSCEALKAVNLVQLRQGGKVQPSGASPREWEKKMNRSMAPTERGIPVSIYLVEG